MPNIFQTLIVRRFLAHLLELGFTFAITLILLQVLMYTNNYILGYGDFINNLNDSTPSLGNFNSNDMAQKSIESVYQLIVGFTLFYFIFTSFNFFFTFSFLYPRNDFQANLFQRIFGFKKFDFGKKKITHLSKAFRMLLRETILFLSIYGFFGILVLTKSKDFFDMFNGFIQAGATISNVFYSLMVLFIIFVLPSVILSAYALYKTKGKQLFWDWATGISLK